MISLTKQKETNFCSQLLLSIAMILALGNNVGKIVIMIWDEYFK